MSIETVAKAGGKGLGLAGLDEKQLEDQMKNLGAQTKNKRAARKVARNKDTIHTLLDAMKTKPKFTKMVEYSVECLKNLAVDEVIKEGGKRDIDRCTCERLCQVYD